MRGRQLCLGREVQARDPGSPSLGRQTADLVAGRVKCSLRLQRKPRRHLPGTYPQRVHSLAGFRRCPQRARGPGGREEVPGASAQRVLHSERGSRSPLGWGWGWGWGRHSRWSKEHQMCCVEVSSHLVPLWQKLTGVSGSLPWTETIPPQVYFYFIF